MRNPIPEDAGITGGQKITNPLLSPTLQNMLNVEGGAGFLQVFLPRLVGLSIAIGVLIFFFVMIVGAIQWISSGGDKTGLEGARGKIANALIGIVVLFAAFAIIKVIEDFFGVNILTLDIGPLKVE